MSKDSAMLNTAHQTQEPQRAPVTPWSLRAWPPLLWQAGTPARVRFHHLGTRVMLAGDPLSPTAGQTLWAGSAAEGEAGMAWDWVQIARGVVAIADPMSVITNLRLVGQAGEVLTAQEAARFLNAFVRTLPWQHEVQRALRGAPN
jgi:hypothetical protein